MKVKYSYSLAVTRQERMTMRTDEHLKLAVVRLSAEACGAEEKS